MLKLGVLVSGSGTNLQAILDAVESGHLKAQVAVVISNRADAKAIERAQARAVPTVIIPHIEYSTRESFDEALVRELVRHDVQWVVLAGFMRIVTRVLLNAFPDRVINIHPALLPAFPGVRAQKQALEHGVKVTGCTVHFVENGVDCGPIIAQRAIDVFPSDDETSLVQRLLLVEHEVLVESLRQIAAGKLALEAGPAGRRRVVVSA